MKNIIKRLILPIILATFYFNLTGCSGNQPPSQGQEVSNRQMGISSENITDIPDKNTVITEAADKDGSANSSEISNKHSKDNINNIDNIDDAGSTDNMDTTGIIDTTGNIDTTDTALDVIKNNDVSDAAVGDTEFTFEEASETVYATVNVNIRTACSTEQDNVVSVLDKGGSIKRVGINDEWSKVLYLDEVCYIRTEYLTLYKPVADDIFKDTATASEITNSLDLTSTSDIVTDTPVITEAPSPTKTPDTSALSSGTLNNNASTSEESFVADLNLAPDINQLVCVVGNGGSDCIVSFHVKSDDGKWLQQFSTDGDCGSKGISYHKKEGDGKSPAGLFPFTLAFGIKADPGAKLSYRQITKYDYWIDDSDSPYYNTWVNAQEIPGDYVSEHLIDHAPQYNYVLNIDYNPNCTPGLGSAIFLHGYNGLGKTTGCIAIAEKYMKTLIQEVDCSTRILIVPDSEDLLNY